MFYKSYSRRQALVLSDALEFLEDAVRQSVDGLVGGTTIKVIRGSGRLTLKFGEQSFVATVIEDSDPPETAKEPEPTAPKKGKPKPAKPAKDGKTSKTTNGATVPTESAVLS